MSYILDALKKVEHEKLKKSAPGSMTSITGDLFQSQIPRTAPAERWKVLVVIALVSFVTFAVTWFMLRNTRPKNTPISSSAVTSTANPAVTASRAPIAASAPATVVVESVVSSPAPAPAPEIDDEDERPKRLPETSAAAVRPLPVKPPLQSIQPPADLKLSGIAWQDERSARRAVVNGFLLKEGAVVSGARIAEIRADRVRFSLSGRTFEIKLDSAPVGEVRQ